MTALRIDLTLFGADPKGGGKAARPTTKWGGGATLGSRGMLVILKRTVRRVTRGGSSGDETLKPVQVDGIRGSRK